jgi:hypothetical protein
MIYLRVKWLHSHVEEPIVLYSELNDLRQETRKIDIYSDGSACIATETEVLGGFGLSPLPIPPLHEIAADPQFEPKEISELEFEEAWKDAKGKLRGERGTRAKRGHTLFIGKQKTEYRQRVCVPVSGDTHSIIGKQQTEYR